MIENSNKSIYIITKKKNWSRKVYLKIFEEKKFTQLTY